MKSQLIGKDTDAGKDRGQEEKEVTEDEMVGCHLQLNGREFEQTLADSLKAGKPGVLQSMGSQRVRQPLVAEQQHGLQVQSLVGVLGCHASHSQKIKT